MDRYRVSGSNAYAPLPVRRPSRLPDEPQIAPKPAPKKTGIAPFTVVGTITALLLVLCVLFSYVRLFETQSEQKQLEAQRDALLQEQERLQLEYESEIDLDEIALRAAELGMHLPQTGQLQTVQVGAEQTQVRELPKSVSMNVFEAFQALMSDLQAYFS